jgi:uroporphyrinogen decarboxylase
VVFDLQLEAELLGCAMKWAEQTPPSVTSHPLGRAELSELPPFDTNRGRYPIVAKALTQLKRQWNDEVALYGLITGPFTLALHLMGTDIFLRMFDDTDQVQRLLEFCTEVGKKAADFYLDNGADVIAVVDPMTSQISPEHFRTFVTQGVNEVFDRIRTRGGLSSLFVCGNATRNLEEMCQTNCDNVSVDENISLDDLRDLARNHGKSFGGNLKLTTVLLLGTEADARRDTIRCLDTGGTTGFVLAPGCDLPYSTPEANLRAVARLVHDPYQQQVARVEAATPVDDEFEEIRLPDYDREQHVTVDVVTLDSASCAPCQYMVKAVEKAASELGGKVIVREHKITTRTGLGHMAKLGVGQIPTICIDGDVVFPSIIPDINTLIQAIDARAKGKPG